MGFSSDKVMSYKKYKFPAQTAKKTYFQNFLSY